MRVVVDLLPQDSEFSRQGVQALDDGHAEVGLTGMKLREPTRVSALNARSSSATTSSDVGAG